MAGRFRSVDARFEMYVSCKEHHQVVSQVKTFFTLPNEEQDEEGDGYSDG